jgi:excisionase family DNA binding protein
VNGAGAGRLLSVGEAAEVMGTPERFVRRLIAERRIAYHKIGKYVRIAETDVVAFVQAGRVEPVRVQWRSGRVVA